MKACLHCGSVESFAEFHRNPRTKDKLSVVCKACACERTRAWSKANPERKRAADRAYRVANHAQRLAADRKRYAQNKSASRSYRLEKNFGITVEEYDALLGQQKGVCAICGAPPGQRRLAVDHCHQTGHVRGLLCAHCNSGIGQFRDDPERLNKAIDYLMRLGNRV